MLKPAILTILLLYCGTLFPQFSIGAKVEYGKTFQQEEEHMILLPHKRIDHIIQLQHLGDTKTIGIFTQFIFGYLFLQPELLFTEHKNSFIVKSFNSELSNHTQIIEEQFIQLDIPIYSGIKYKKFRIGVGPIFNYSRHIETGYSKFDDTEIETGKINAGVQFGIGLDLKCVHIDLKYQNGFESVSDHLLFNGLPTKMETTTDILKLGVAVAF